MYLYPNNLKSKATLWFWELKDIGIIGVTAIIAVIIYTKIGIMFPIAFVGTYAFLTIKIDDSSILDFIKYAFRYFVINKQIFEWEI